MTLERLTSQFEQAAIMEMLTPETLERLRLFYVLPQMIAVSLALILLFFYPLSRERLAVIRRELRGSARQGRSMVERIGDALPDDATITRRIRDCERSS